MIEKKLYSEIPGGNNNFHSAILTTYAFNVYHFENQVLKNLKQKWITSINILVDQRVLNNEFGVLTGNSKTLSRYYSLSGIKCEGAFHPKINFLIGDNKLLMFFGSGNITPSGHGKNHELFTCIYADNKDSLQLPLLKESWQYLLNKSEKLNGYIKTRISKTIPCTCSLLEQQSNIQAHQFQKLEDNIEVALLYNGETSIFEQLTSLIPKDEIIEITIICPYYDQNGETILNLQEHFNNPKVNVYVQKESGLPPTSIKLNSNINFYDWDKTERASKAFNKSEFKRNLHSKIFHFKSQNGEYCMIGSANATIQAIGGPKMTYKNDEFGALYKFEGHKTLGKLGLKRNSEKVSIKDYKRQNENLLVHDGITQTSKKIHIYSVDLNHAEMTIYFDQDSIEIGNKIAVYNTQGKIILKHEIDSIANKVYKFRTPKETFGENPTYIQVLDNNEIEISGKQAINHIIDLENTDPTKSNRTLVQLIANIQNRGINDFDIIEYINSINHEKKSNDSKTAPRFVKENIKNPIETDDQNNQLTYEEALSIDDQNTNSISINSSSYESKLWEAFSRIFSANNQEIVDELMDEEEDGKAEQGRDRKESTSTYLEIQIKNKNDWSKKYKSIKSLCDNYISSLESLQNKKDITISVTELHKFLLATHLLAHFGNFIIYSFKENIDIGNEKINLLFQEKMLKILIEFTKLCFYGKNNKLELDVSQELKLELVKKEVLTKSFLYLYLLEIKTNYNNALERNIELIGLNLLKYLGTPDFGFEERIITIANNYIDTINPKNVMRFKDKIISKISTNGTTNNFLIINHSGVCKKIEQEGTTIKYQSLHGINSISIIKKNEFNLELEIDI